MAKEFSYEVKNTIGQLSEKKYLKVVAWNGREAKLDVREWYEKDGEERCGKGISLNNEEAKKLVDLLTKYLDDGDDDF